LQRRTLHDRNRVAWELIALQQLANFQFNKFEQLGVFHHVALVQKNHHRGYAHLPRQQNVLARLRHRPIRRRNH